MTEHHTLTAANGSRWSVTVAAVNPYGRPVPAGRECWAWHLDGEAPAGLRGVAGFYAASLAEVRARLDA
jgi:hypothetical protein